MVEDGGQQNQLTPSICGMHGICFSSVQPAEGNVNAAYEAFKSQISNVIDRHIPVKQAYQRKKKFPCMNSVLKKSFFLKKRIF